MDTARLVGERIDQYEILNHIARGGMADVYLAKDVDLERNVAFKVMLDMLALDDQYVRRFQREARTVARLDHPNIVQVYSTGQTRLGQPYITMQYIDGGSLRDKISELARRNKRLTTEQVLNIMRQIAIALGEAHKADVVHRDLKPSNVLIRPDGTPVLVDLGIAAVRTEAKLTHTGGFVGTPAYMSPEQIRSKPLDDRSDLYSLGIIFYELFAGARPFNAEDVTGIMFQQVHEEPVPLKKLRPDLSAQTLAIVDTLLKKKPEQRFQTAESVVSAIDRAILAEGRHHPSPNATQLLTYINDSELISQGGVVRAVTNKWPSGTRHIPLWVIIMLFVSIGAVAAFMVLKPDIGITSLARATATEKSIEEPTEETTDEQTATEEPTVAVTEPLTLTISATPTILPSETPSPTVLPTEPPTRTPTMTPSLVCVGSSPTRLSVGDKARVINSQINVRSGPGTNFGVVNTLLPDRWVDIVEGPECNDGQLWYHLISELFTNSAGDQIQVEGWSVEESGDTYFLEPAN